jgi:hypothetical protein
MPTTLNANASAPRRTLRSAINVAIDLTVTPPASTAGAINNGELVYLTANYAAASLNTTGAANANAARMIGIANDNYPYTWADGVTSGEPNMYPAALPLIQIYEDGDHLMLTTVGDTYNAYDAVYLGANGRTIQKTASGTTVGYVCPDQRQAGTTVNPNVSGLPIVGAVDVSIYIRITPALAK